MGNQCESGFNECLALYKVIIRYLALLVGMLKEDGMIDQAEHEACVGYVGLCAGRTTLPADWDPELGEHTVKFLRCVLTLGEPIANGPMLHFFLGTALCMVLDDLHPRVCCLEKSSDEARRLLIGSPLMALALSESKAPSALSPN